MKPDIDVGPNQYNLPSTLTKISFTLTKRPNEFIKKDDKMDI